ncbi:replication protein A, subunit RPA32 [Gloeophyllum trabeum ATCC 11539]|uniref:Replication protein A, subunit RPA32 n=1 Tax=Gloeophyllum trabeum (strain ATCC 11539 / FP-39264 / Madison 617) TaxID=670483 RepID=S7RXG2_GLOTA|nr:replication protein A, subunit RPA32 [Gloeophyllum trabeum ATCC 11539]EPQ58034.1 replication protein A, subunit RPA32 [Gloeophyllum trabeum ATCC 11539]
MILYLIPVHQRSAAAQSLRPVKVKQLYSATQAHTDAEWKIEDIEVGQVSVVGTVVSIQPGTTNSVYWIDDGTGRIEARHWNGTEEDNAKWADVVENIYVRVTGTPKMFGNKRYINATNIRPTKDLYEPFFHELESIYVTRFYREGPPGGSGNADHNMSPNGQGSHASNYTAQASAGQSDQWASLPPMQRAIMNFMASQPDDSDEGIHVGAIARAVRGEPDAIRYVQRLRSFRYLLTLTQRSAALDALMDDGRIYSTSDESHFKMS